MTNPDRSAVGSHLASLDYRGPLPAPPSRTRADVLRDILALERSILVRMAGEAFAAMERERQEIVVHRVELEILEAGATP